MLGKLERITPAAGRSFRVLHWSNNLRDVESLLDAHHTERIPGKGAHSHHHVEMELTTFTSGQGVFFVGDHIGPFAAGEVVLLGEHLPHHWHARGPSSGFSVQWNFPPSHPLWAFPETLPLDGLFKRAGRGIRYVGPTASAMTANLRAIASATGLDRLGLLLRLLSLMSHASAEAQALLSCRSFSLPADSLHQEATKEALRYLLANFRNPIRLEEVLRLTHMSKATFSLQFKKYAGKTFREAVAHLRLQSACRELIETDRPVLTIGLSCGFSEISFFNRLFRRVMRCSLLEYRARERRRQKLPAEPGSLS